MVSHVDAVFVGDTDAAGTVTRVRTLAPTSVQLLLPPFPNGFAQVRYGTWDDTGWVPGPFPPGVLDDSVEVGDEQTTATYRATRRFLADPDERVVATRELELFTDGIGGGAGDPGPHFAFMTHQMDAGQIVELPEPIVELPVSWTFGPRGLPRTGAASAVPDTPAVPDALHAADGESGTRARKGDKPAKGRKSGKGAKDKAGKRAKKR